MNIMQHLWVIEQVEENEKGKQRWIYWIGFPTRRQARKHKKESQQFGCGIKDFRIRQYIPKEYLR